MLEFIIFFFFVCRKNTKVHATVSEPLYFHTYFRAKLLYFTTRYGIALDNGWLANDSETTVYSEN